MYESNAGATWQPDAASFTQSYPHDPWKEKKANQRHYVGHCTGRTRYQMIEDDGARRLASLPVGNPLTP